MSKPVHPLPLAATPTHEVTRALAAALDGSGPALLPVGGQDPLADLALRARVGETVNDDVALLLTTSGSTGTPKVVVLGAKALLASAAATDAHLGGPGRWLLTLPLNHIAGWQVMVRSQVAGQAPAVLPTEQPFRAEDLASALRSAAGTGRRINYLSLVPTQLHRVLQHREAREALASVDAVLVGGALMPDTMRTTAADAGINVVRTYGMTETSGGCVYDGTPLAGVRVRADENERLYIAGPMLANGYAGLATETAETFITDDAGTRWLRTNDLGRVDPLGRLSVLGRADDVIVSGGEKVSPIVVENVLTSLPGIAAAVVVSVPDDEWGQRVVALVQPSGSEPLSSPEQIADAVANRCGRAAVPRPALVVDEVPSLGIGKPDRAQARQIAIDLLGTP